MLKRYPLQVADQGVFFKCNLLLKHNYPVGKSGVMSQSFQVKLIESLLNAEKLSPNLTAVNCYRKVLGK